MECYCFVLRVASLESERADFTNQLRELQYQLRQSEAMVHDLQQQCDRTRGELTYSRNELDQYRFRAQRILQDKERLITELQGQG
jgi:chromosome segregation ATPase